MMLLTVKSFLSVRAVRSNDSMYDIDWCSSNNPSPCNLQQMTVLSWSQTWEATTEVVPSV